MHSVSYPSPRAHIKYLKGPCSSGFRAFATPHLPLVRLKGGFISWYGINESYAGSLNPVSDAHGQLFPYSYHGERDALVATLVGLRAET